MIGDFVRMQTEIPEGLFVKHIPKGRAAYVQIEGSNGAEILDSAYLLITEAIEKTELETGDGALSAAGGAGELRRGARGV